MRTRSQIKKEWDAIPKTLDIVKEEQRNKTYGDGYPEIYEGHVQYFQGWYDALQWALGICPNCKKPGREVGYYYCKRCRNRKHD